MPSVYCQFAGCTVHSSTPGKRLYRFPKEEERCQKWVTAAKNPKLVGIPASTLYKNAHLCDEHFRNWCFMNASDKKRLVWNAIPSQSSPIRMPPSPVPSVVEDESLDATSTSHLYIKLKPTDWKEWKKEKKKRNKEWMEQKILKKLQKKEKGTAEQLEAKTEDSKEEILQKGRHYTMSIALPGSILDNAQSPQLRTYLAGQIARAAAIFNIDEIIVFDETGSTNLTEQSVEGEFEGIGKKGQGNVQLGRILQYLECPQYLRKYLFPIHKDLNYAGLLNPLDASHHLRTADQCIYREGVVINKPVKDGSGSYVYVGVQKHVQIDKHLQQGVRVTVKLNQNTLDKKKMRGEAVAPSVPRLESGIYWGYSVRLAKSLGAVFTDCPFKNGYDLTIGTSERGEDVDNISLPTFEHLLIVFGGLGGLEASLDADEGLMVDNPRFLFHFYLNTCPDQGSRIIRTEEAILISLSALRPNVLRAQQKFV